jgi:uncharacterized protein YraI
MRSWRLLTATLLLVGVPTAAFAARGTTTSDVNMRAGPGTEYPAVTTVPENARVNIHGCLSDYGWCDVSWSGDRGWISAQYLDYYYNNRYVYLPDYVDVIDVPVVTFTLSSYWANYYPHRPWYRRLDHWAHVWQSNGRYGHVAHQHGRHGRQYAVPEHIGRKYRAARPGRGPLVLEHHGRLHMRDVRRGGLAGVHQSNAITSHREHHIRNTRPGHPQFAHRPGSVVRRGGHDIRNAGEDRPQLDHHTNGAVARFGHRGGAVTTGSGPAAPAQHIRDAGNAAPAHPAPHAGGGHGAPQPERHH